MLSTANASNWALRSISALLGAEEDVGVEGAAETKAYKPIPIITDFTDENGKDCMRDMIHSNYNRVKEEVKQIVKDELTRIANDENLSHLLQKK